MWNKLSLQRYVKTPYKIITSHTSAWRCFMPGQMDKSSYSMNQSRAHSTRVIFLKLFFRVSGFISFYYLQNKNQKTSTKVIYFFVFILLNESKKLFSDCVVIDSLPEKQRYKLGKLIAGLWIKIYIYSKHIFAVIIGFLARGRLRLSPFTRCFITCLLLVVSKILLEALFHQNSVATYAVLFTRMKRILCHELCHLKLTMQRKLHYKNL